MKKITLLSFVIAVIFGACTDNPNAQLIQGNWQGVEWMQSGTTAGHNAAATFFSFDEKGNYSYTYQSNKESGTYKVENDMLFTRPEGQLEIMVKIAKLTNDTLIFDMSRAGSPETLTLVKVK